MNDRVDQKLQDVVVARFRFRHEAEFAAGFLDDAGIPYRLQVDDAAMGMTFATPATLWVRGMDVTRAREVLDLPPRDALEGGEARRAAVVPSDVDLTRPSPAGDRLSVLERSIAAALCATTLGLQTLVASDRRIWLVVALAFAGVTGGAALFGRTFTPLRRLLRVLSGTAP